MLSWGLILWHRARMNSRVKAFYKRVMRCLRPELIDQNSGSDDFFDGDIDEIMIPYVVGIPPSLDRTHLSP